MTMTYLSMIIFISTSLVGSIIGVFLLFKFLGYFQQKQGSFVLLQIRERLKWPLSILIPILVIGIFIPSLKLCSSYIIIPNIIQATIIFLFTWVLLEFIWIGQAVLEHRCDSRESGRARTLKTQIRFIRRLLNIIVVFIMLAVFLMTFENARRLGVGLLTSAGIFSVVMGLAAQKTLSSVLAGFQVAFNKALRVGDGVYIEKEWGQVEEITLTHVILRLMDNRRFILPINYFMDKPYQNWSLVSSELTYEISLILDYTVNLSELRKELDRILADEPLWDKKLKSIQVTDMTEKCMIVRILLSAKNATDMSNLTCKVREKMMNYICQHQPNVLSRMRTETKTV